MIASSYFEYWEYNIVSIIGDHNTVKMILSKPEEGPREPSKEFRTLLDQMGELGWELAPVTGEFPEENLIFTECIFKKRKL